MKHETDMSNEEHAEWERRADELGVSGSERRLVRLVQCGRRSCGYILTEGERVWVPSKNFDMGQTAVCPICEEDSFYTLKPNGQKVKFSERDDYRDGIDPTMIEPAPRMGPKVKAYLRDAKRRILEANRELSRPPSVNNA